MSVSSATGASAADIEAAARLVRKTVPDVDSVIVEYVVNCVADVIKTVLETESLSGQHEADEERLAPFLSELSEVVAPILEDAGGKPDTVSSTCSSLAELIRKATHAAVQASAAAVAAANAAAASADGSAGDGLAAIATPGLLPRAGAGSRRIGGSAGGKLTRLSAPVNIMMHGRAKGGQAFDPFKPVDLSSAGSRSVASQVDTRKLEKAEARIKAKIDRRENEQKMSVGYEQSKILTDAARRKQQEEEEMLRVNPILDYTSTRGKSKDVKLVNFDVSLPSKQILKDSSLHLITGRRHFLIGRNGVGKSTLLRALSRRELDVPSHISILHVEQEMRGDDTPALQSVLKADMWREYLLREEREINAKLALPDDDPSVTEDDRTQLSSRLMDIHAKLQDIDSDTAEARASTILYGLGFSQEQLQWPTKAFSGGWRMRLSLGRALFSKPDLLLLDEPTNMLDVPAVAFLEQYLLKAEGQTMLIVSHDRAFMDAVATDVIHQHSQQLFAYRGNFSQFNATREDRRKQLLREYEAQQMQVKHLQEFIAKWRYNANRAAQAQMKIKQLEKMVMIDPPEDDAVVTFKFTAPDALSPPILRMSGVEFGYSPESPAILRSVEFDITMDTRAGIIGANGAGKTTMLKLLTGVLEPRGGIVQRNPRLRVGYFTQHHVDQLDVNETAVGFMMSKFPGRSDEEARRYLGSFGISGMTALQKIETLSGGQKSRVAFAVLAMQRPHVLVLDEVSNHLDVESMDALSRALETFEGAVVLVSHDEWLLQAVCKELWICGGGTLSRFDGTIREYKTIVCPPDA
ncbi:P-loop containing nucleoside triphosphate hydrolase protein [Ramicandelaber brevisporus]|nr:P-loop containing nucleoside triphosphate hydrolase protein [Ramicandelaber brevisporus]